MTPPRTTANRLAPKPDRLPLWLLALGLPLTVVAHFWLALRRALRGPR